MRRHAMTLTALAMAAPAVVRAANNPGGRALALAAALALWALVEFFIARFRSYEGIVPADAVVEVSRMLWAASAVFTWLDVHFGWTRVEMPTGLAGALAILALAGAALRFWAVLHLGESFSYDVKRPTGGRLVRTGPYGLVRHPAYLGLFLVCTFPGLALGSLLGFAALTATTLASTVRRARAEDAMMEHEFGEEFRRYAREVRGLFPGIY